MTIPTDKNRMPRVLMLSLVLILLVSCTAAEPAVPTPAVEAAQVQPATAEPTAAASPTLTAEPPTASPTPVPQKPTLKPSPTKVPLPFYANAGPYPVAYQKMALQDGDIKFNTHVWMPAAGDKRPDVANGPFPLVIFSPGYTARGFTYEKILKPLASYGFVVISPDPVDTEAGTGAAFQSTGIVPWPGFANRPMQVKFVIDYAEKMTSPGGEWAGLIDMQKIAMMGHSFGGDTALIIGGAQMDFGWCGGNPECPATYQYCDCVALPYLKDIAARLGLSNIPTGPWPAMGDPRVTAVVAMSPDGDLWGKNYAGVSSLNVPALIMTGSADELISPSIGAIPIYQNLGSAEKTLLTFKSAGHMFFTSGLPWPFPGNPINHFVTAFLLAELKGDAEAAKYLSPENNTVPDVLIKTTGYTGK